MGLIEESTGQVAQASSCEASVLQETLIARSESQSTLEETMNALQETSSEPCELDKPEFKTDEFRLYHFKIQPCCNEEPHDWCLCPFAHPGEKAQRRDPRLHKYTGISCPDYRKGTCKRGNACPYAHGVFEVWLHPSRYRTQTCKDAPHCTRQVCFFAHSLEEVRTVEPEDLPVLTDDAPAAGVDIASTLSHSIEAAEGAASWPKCGANTNAKAAAAAKAKAAAAAAAGTKDSSNSSSPRTVVSSSSAATSSKCGVQNATGLVDSWNTAASAFKLHMSRQASNCSSTATSVSQITGLESLCSLSSALSTPGLPPLPNSSAYSSQQALLQGNRLLPVPTDIALEAAALRAAAAAANGASLCNTFGSLDLNGVLAGGVQLGSSASYPAAGSLGCESYWGAAAAAAPVGVGMLPHSSPMGFADGTGHNAMNELVMATAAHQAVAAQHQEVQDLLQAVLLHQRQLAQAQQHRDAMWTAAYNAAADVGLNPATAAVCADAAVQNTTSAAAAAAPATQHQLQMQQLLSAQQQQHHTVASAPMDMLSVTTMPLMNHMAPGSAVGHAPVKQFSNHFHVLEQMQQQQQQQQLLPAGALMMQQANMLAANMDAFGTGKLNGLVGQVQGQMCPYQLSVTAGGAFGGMQ